MTYEQEQAQYQAQLNKIKAQMTELEEIINNSPETIYTHHNHRKSHIHDIFRQREQEQERMILQMMLREKYGDYSSENSVLKLRYKLLEHEKKDIEYKLKETKNQRRANKTLEYLENITPQHVSGRVYKVNDGDAFGTFCLWFCIIGTVIVLIYVLISGDI